LRLKTSLKDHHAYAFVELFKGTQNEENMYIKSNCLLIIDQNKVNWKSINQYSLFVNLRNEIDF
jgi:hypothetical protein